MNEQDRKMICESRGGSGCGSHERKQAAAGLFQAPERKRECSTCNRWARFYIKTKAGPFMKVSYGLCMKPGHWEVREPQEACEEHRYEQKEG